MRSHRPCSCPDTSPHHGTTHLLHKPGNASLPIPSPHLQRTTPCFPSVLTTYLIAVAKWRQISNISSSGMWITETAAGIRHNLLSPLNSCCYLQKAYRLLDTKYSTVHLTKSYKRLFKLPNVLFPTYLAVNTRNP